MKVQVQWIMSGEIEVESADAARKMSLYELEQAGVIYLEDSLVVDNESVEDDDLPV